MFGYVGEYLVDVLMWGLEGLKIMGSKVDPD